MFITPIIPQTNEIKLDNNLLNKAELVVIKSAKLTGGHNIHFINAIKDLLRITNSYYSNRIESEGTHPIDIEKAMKKEFSNDEKKKDLQQLSLIHIEIQKYLENEALQIDNTKLYSLDTILEVHKKFYSKKELAYALKIKYENLEVDMIAGELRKHFVKVGNHIAPDPDELGACFNEFETLYNQCRFESQTMKLIYALCSHHRFVYIHPFYDGNGRISRLYLDYLLQKINLEGYGLWNLSRGLARNVESYKKALAIADESYKGGYDDGRGNLSLKALKQFLEFMLDTALDQIEYMSSVIRMDLIASRISNYVEFSQKNMYPNINPLPKHSQKIFEYLLMYGEIPRNSIKDILNVSKPTAIKIVKELEERGYLSSIETQSPIRIKFNSHFASEIIPELFPKSNL
ncbi:cell filamentation protein Fic [Arcobacter sp. FW59]|nr:cell filamentation protein Fic [Arcobacter sp. FW59]